MKNVIKLWPNGVASSRNLKNELVYSLELGDQSLLASARKSQKCYFDALPARTAIQQQKLALTCVAWPNG